MSFAQPLETRRASKRLAFRTFAIALTTALIVLFLPGVAFAAGEPIVAIVEGDEVHRQLAADDQLFEERRDGVRCAA